MKQEKETLTYVVFMEHKDLTLFKIGKSKDLKSRIRQHRSSNPFLRDFYTFNVDVERYFKLCFKQYRIFEDSKREWFDFKLSKEQTLDIIKNAFIYLDEQILKTNYQCCDLQTAHDFKNILNKQLNEHTRNTQSKDKPTNNNNKVYK